MVNNRQLEEGWSKFNELTKAYNSITNEDLNDAVEKLLEKYKEPLSKINNDIFKDVFLYGEVDTDKYVKKLIEYTDKE